MTEKQLDEIIRLIPLATVKQVGVILGQINVHLMLKLKNGKKH
tara:strand:+ start:3210 stop:3338 length:129 start_codon:yes stop_codon:yes gene_type:complete